MKLIEETTAKSAPEAEEAIEALHRRYRGTRLIGKIIERDRAWAAAARELEATRRAALRLSAEIPGPALQKLCLRLSRDVEQQIVAAQRKKTISARENLLELASHRCAELQRAVEMAARLRDAAPALADEIAALDGEMVSASVSSRAAYDSLRETAEAMRPALAAGDYDLVLRRFEAAQRMKTDLQANLDRHLRMARNEIALWKRRESIAAQFQLDRFGDRIGFDELPRWLETRERIGAYVLTQARRILTDNAAAMKARGVSVPP
jgi:hypothetical protein